MNPDKLKLASIQMVSGVSLEDNLTTAALLIAQAAEQGAEMVVLPEYFAIMPFKETDKLAHQEAHGKGVVQTFLASQASQHQLWIIGGTHPIKSAEIERPFGRCYVYNPDGGYVCHYDKIHLFDVAVDDNHKQYCESRYSSPGSEAVTFATPWGRIGLAVCYDLRFPELFRQLVEQQAKIMLLPAAFTRATGQAHWEVLLKARAIENLSFVVASAQGGEHQNGRETWGHSCIISPWGETLAELDVNQGVVCATVDLQQQQKKRNEFPVLSHRRL